MGHVDVKSISYRKGKSSVSTEGKKNLSNA